ncbi:MAG: hypothetical protein AB7V13_06015 [Pseudorhodoplanes sp.]|uniref:hypothetical protein n=1 Tax=Pseudorhodoplanes sp. TaxID=1934341 RepID=UPI003D0969AE
MVLFRFPRWVMGVLLAISLALVAMGLGMVATGADGGWPGLLFFGLCSAVFAAQLWPHLLLSAPAETPDALLQRFPGPVELHVPQRKTALLVVCAVIFAGVCAAYLNSERPGLLVATLIWFCMIALVLSLPFLVFQFLRGASLRLEGDGFRVKQPWKWRFVRWKDASEFGIGSTAIVEQVKGDWSTVVTYDDSNVDESNVNILGQSIIGRNSALPDTYGLSPENLQTLMNGWRQRALQA